MKNNITALICGSLVMPALLYAQTAATPANSTTTNTHAAAVQTTPKQTVASEKQELTRFDLDFPGGNPLDLVKAIEKAMGRPVNVIIGNEYLNGEVQIPPIKLWHVNAVQLFNAIQESSTKTLPYVTGTYFGPNGKQTKSFSLFNSSYGFKASNETKNDDTVWTFFYNKREPEPTEPTVPEMMQICRFYPMSDCLLDHSIDDISTAMKTGFNLLGEGVPKFSYHAETKLLIVVGTTEQHKLIESLFEALTPISVREANTRVPVRKQETGVPKKSDENVSVNATNNPAAKKP